MRQSLGEPDPFKLLYRAKLRELVANLIRERIKRIEAPSYITKWVTGNVDIGDRLRFSEIIEAELTGLHERNFARYQIRSSEFEAWRKVWDSI